MIVMQNTETKQYVKCITGDEVAYTNAVVDAFDFDKQPSDEEKQTFHNWILGAGEKAPVEFVEA